VEAVILPSASQQGSPKQRPQAAPMPLPPGLSNTFHQGTPNERLQPPPMPLPPGLCSLRRQHTSTQKGPSTSHSNNRIPAGWHAANQGYSNDTTFLPSGPDGRGYYSNDTTFLPAEVPPYVPLAKDEVSRRSRTASSDVSTTVSDEDHVVWHRCSV